MKDFFEYSDSTHKITQEAKEDMASRLQTASFKKGEHLLRDGQICRRVYFLKKGLAKMYLNKDGKQVIHKFMVAPIMFAAPESFLSQRPSRVWLTALTDIETYTLTYKDIMELCDHHHSVERLIRLHAARMAMTIIDRVNTHFFDSASERYRSFMEEFKDVYDEIPLGDIAAYLGISQVSLSRIRAKKDAF
ncbi:cyclic nucleotide-binding protein (plasmid) [Fulvitalea axinellae]|uniref:Cyclic nucleotide-binding protein n=1 Tax=Fulvitalea axinellae TaxID=1182444 RepID=A0AAU9CI27_9BACT|nr:cyclic nucleotide-binding protein [Fulvitalea axinellae]